MQVKYLQDILNALPPCLHIRDYYIYDRAEDTTYFQIAMENMPLDNKIIPGLYKTLVTVEKDREHPVNPVSLEIENRVRTPDGTVLLKAGVSFEDMCGKRSYLIDHIRYLMPEVFDSIHDPLISYVNYAIKSVKKSISESERITEIIHDEELSKKQEEERLTWRLERVKEREKFLEKLERIKNKLIHPAPLKD